MVAQHLGAPEERSRPLDLEGELIPFEEALRKYHGEAILIRVKEEEALHEPALTRVLAHSLDGDAMSRMVDEEPVRSQLWADDPRDYFIIHTPQSASETDPRSLNQLVNMIRRPRGRRV